MNPEQAWQSVIDEMQSFTGRENYETWSYLSHTRFVSLEDGIFTVAAEYQNECDSLRKSATKTLLRLLQPKLTQTITEVHFTVKGTPETKPENPEQAWKHVIRKLQEDMPRASFDTWVRDSQFVSLKDGIFTVATRNLYARDWLQSRLTDVVSGLLAEIFEQSVSVHFIVSSSVDEVEVNDGADAPVAIDAGGNETASETASSVIRARVSMSEYEQIVKPARKIVFPSYFLRHIPRIGPELAWIVIALRQLVFLSHDSKPIPGREIARWAGMSRRAFWRWSKRIGSMKEFVDRHPETVDGQHVIAYTVWADDSCPLTPADARSLVAALTDLLQQYGSPEQAASALIEMTSAEIRTRILPLEPNLLEEGTGECVTVNELVQWLGWPPELGMRLEKRIMDAFGLTVLTWHFVLQLLPALDHGPAWMITILRDLCYDGREQRSSALLPPVTLARMCGLQGKWMRQTLNTWLRKPLVQTMAADEDLGDRVLGPEKPHRYRVSFFDAILSENGSRESGTTPQSDQGDPSRASGTGVEAKRHKDRGQVAQGLRPSDTGVEAKWHKGRGQVAQGLRASGTTLTS